ncbi:MAG: hypothetical protein Kow0031_33440 [Anaerolineae bacterium]
MGRKTNIEVRDHTTEREWLLQMGGGNLVNGVQQLVQQAAKQGKLEYGAPDPKKGRK